MVNNHGDLVLYPTKKLKPIKAATKAHIHVLQDSGPTGNRHEVVSKKSPIFHWTSGGVEYIHCEEPYTIRHVGGDEEHGVQNVEAGTREVRREVEYDPWKNELRIVID